jgi:hypothetical protein
MSKVSKNNKKIIKELRRMIERNDYWCGYNDCDPTPYIEGVNDTCKSMIKFIKKMNKK